MRIIDNFEALENLAGNRKKILLLFSGGLDSCHTLSKLNSLNWEVTLLHIGLGEPLPNTIEVAKNMSFAYYHEDVVEEFCNNFLAKGIYCNATYYGGMPLSSTFTRPLIAKKAIEYANKLDIDIIASNVTAFQNTFFRIAKTIEILAPEKYFFTPSIGEYITRDSKTNSLPENLKVFFNSSRGVYSIDENLWCKVIENGDIEIPERKLPIKEIRDKEWEGKEVLLELGFKGGIPVSINKVEMKLSDIIAYLNKEFKGHPCSFFYGLEGNIFGIKNPEPRVSIAAYLIYNSLNYLSQATLSSSELQLRSDLSSRFAVSIIEGGWFTSYSNALSKALFEISKTLNGQVVWRLDSKTCDPSQIIPKVKSKIGVHAPNFIESVEKFGLTEKIRFDVMREHTYEK